MKHYDYRQRKGRAGRRSTYGSAALGIGIAAALFSGLVVASSIVGCSGADGNPGLSTGTDSSTSAGKGRAVFTVTWPAASTTRLIPFAANSINVRVLSADGKTLLGESLLVRPSGGGTSTASFERLPVGNAIVIATAYPNADGSGVAQAQAQAGVTIVRDQLTPVALTLGSTITRLDVSSNPTTLVVGQTATFTATPRDAQDNVVLITLSTLKWESSNTSIATVDVAGKVTAVASGTATITATETESGKTASVALSVTLSSPSPTPSPTPTPTPTPSPVPTSNLPASTAYQINAGHSGTITFNQALTFSSKPTWTATLPGKSSYPLIAGGRVFVTCTGGSSSYGTQLYALNEATGQVVWGPISLGGTYYWSALAYDKGKVFTVNFDGLVQSFDAATGAPGWSAKMPGQYAFSAPPTAVNGIVYVGGAGSGGTLYAVSETNGNVLWKAPVANGDQSSPAVALDSAGASTGVFVSYPCQAYGFNALTGASQWRYNGPCSGGGGKTSVYQNGYLYVRDYNGNSIFDAKTGNLMGTFSSTTAPAIGATMGFYKSGGTLQGVDLSTRQVLWSFAGDGSLASAPIVIDQTVVIGSGTGKVYALDAATGSVVWTGTAAAGIPAPDEQNVSQPLTGMAAGEGYLVVPSGTTLTAWHIAGQ